MMRSFKVLVPQPIAKEGIDYLEENGCEAIVPDKYDSETLIERVKDCHAILVRTAEINRDIIEKGKELQIIARHGVGLDNVDIQAATENNIFVCNAPAANINSVAEHVVGLMLAVSHQIVKGDHAVREGDYQARNRYIGSELSSKTLGLIGLGNIGKLVAKKCALGFDMNVVAYDPFIKKVDENYITLEPSLEKLVSQADFLSLHVPYVPELHHVINREMFEKMKETSFLINAARGGLVDEQALYEALASNKIAGAALDCFEQEPTPMDHPLWKLDNVVLTPHMAAHTEEAMIRMAMDPAKEIVRVKNKQEPIVCVNREFLKQDSF
ncbi:hydroxyacid dehydrogenase [Evansella sp. AB-P1]|uniref:hydroxyacid dehydrogenase n=1 Tax=Evansella sp. AB-P1 TaxID=3037653 RepID=UPI0024203771|nr:hydroxyacid dehydrogenase [Evansella sp. AB-P1]MDG5787226.1 hydroxyacid dehydrogenase [Evansella sp. AB-P1]